MWHCSHLWEHTARETGLGEWGSRRELEEPLGTNGRLCFHSSKLPGTKTKEETSSSISGMIWVRRNPTSTTYRKNSERQIQSDKLHEGGQAWGSS